MKEKFTLSDSGQSCFTLMNIGGHEAVEINIEFSGAEQYEEINWNHVSETVKLVNRSYDKLYDEVRRFAGFLVRESGMYDVDTQNKIKGFLPASVEIIKPFERAFTPELKNFCITYNFDSDYWIDVYGVIKVKFLNNHVVGVERVQV